MSFSQVLRNSLSVEKTTPAFCETCKKFTPTNQYARVTDLPQILSVNCGLKNEKEMNFLKKQLNRNQTNSVVNETVTAPLSSTPIKPCRYGTNCSRVDCHFAHSDRQSPASNSINNSSTTNSNGSSRSNIWFPHNFTMEINELNELTIDSATDNNDDSSMSTNKSIDKTNDDLDISELTITVDKNDSELKDGCKINRKIYKLTAVVCQVINGNQRNLVALISVGGQYHKAKLAEHNQQISAQWYIFNDFSIAPVSEQEAVWFTLDWKVPCVLFYSSTEAIEHDGKDITIESLQNNPFIHVSFWQSFESLNIDTKFSKNSKNLTNCYVYLQDIFSQQICKNKQYDLTFKPLTADEMPKKGELVAMDAEFVTLNPEENEIRPDGKMATIKPSHMSVARITCIRGFVSSSTCSTYS